MNREEKREKALELAQEKISEVDTGEEIVKAVKVLDAHERDVETGKLLEDWRTLYPAGAGFTGARLSRRMDDQQVKTEEIREFVEEKISDYASNLSDLMGSMLAARLLERSGGLEDLATSSSSKIQTLGKEGEMFSHLEGKSSAPKHGIISRHDLVESLEENLGKMARFLANKAVIAARLDFYGSKEQGDKLRDEAEEKFAEFSKRES